MNKKQNKKFDNIFLLIFLEKQLKTESNITTK